MTPTGPLQVGRLRPVDRAELQSCAPVAARKLLGLVLLRDDADGGHVLARIVETEAYREDDPASHSAAGRTRRTEPMFARPGTAYVYRSYGIHWCCNVSVEPEGVGAAVLFRAARILAGAASVRLRRPGVDVTHALLRGPGNLCRGLDVDDRHDGGDLLTGVRGLWLGDDGWRPPAAAVHVGPRVGVSQAVDVPWRFSLDDPAVSAYRRSPRAARPVQREKMR